MTTGLTTYQDPTRRETLKGKIKRKVRTKRNKKKKQYV